MIGHHFVRGDDRRSSPTLAALLKHGDVVDANGIALALGSPLTSSLSFVKGVARIVRSAPIDQSIGDSSGLECSLRAELPRHGGTAYALSGGVDAALLLCLAVREELRPIAYTLRPRLSNDSGADRYDEHERAVDTARRLGVELRIVEVDDEDFRRALTPAMRAAETPLYNLHPLGRFLLARQVARDGFHTLVTGDGADERCRGTDGADYLPIVAALTRATGVAPCFPYLCSRVSGLAGDVEKRALRRLLARDLPELAGQKKSAKYAPHIDLSGLADSARMKSLALQLQAYALPKDRLRVGLVCSAILADALGLR